MTDAFVPPWDQRALAIVTQIERAIIRQDLHSQGQFIALTNALEMQSESGDPDPQTVTHLCEALLCLGLESDPSVDTVDRPTGGVGDGKLGQGEHV